MKTLIYTIALSALCFSSCKRNYVCECKNSNGNYLAGETEGTKSQAKKYCQDLSTADTKCNIQQ